METTGQAPGAMRITALRRQRSGAQKLNVYVDGEFRFSLPEEVSVRAGLRLGHVLDDRDIATLIASGAAWSAREAALRMLSRRARSRGEIRRLLLARQHSLEAVEACLEQLTDAGLLDDEQFARALVRDRIRNRPKGLVGLAADLRAKGVDAGLASQAIRETLESETVSELQLARKAATRFRVRGMEDRVATRRRLRDFLARRGFSADVIADVVAERIGAIADDETEPGV